MISAENLHNKVEGINEHADLWYIFIKHSAKVAETYI